MAAFFGLVFGLPSVRTRGEYLAVITLAFGEIVPAVIVHLPDLTGGPRGMSGIPSVLADVAPTRPTAPVYAVAALLMMLLYLGIGRLAASRTGRAWAALRDDELAARSVGVDPPAEKLLAFAVGAGCAGLAGALFAGLFGHVEPEQFDLTLSLMVLAAVVIGGRWGLPGIVVGALAIALYDRLLVDVVTDALRTLGAALEQPLLLRADFRGDNFLVFGLVLYLAVLLRARGLPSVRRARDRRLTATRRPATTPSQPTQTP